MIFAGTSRITDHFPQAGARFLDATVRPILGNSDLSRVLARRNLNALQKVKSFNKILIIPDTHIGDTVMMQAAATALRDFFPSAQIDYITNQIATPLVEGNPEISSMIPVFSGGLFPSPEHIETIRKRNLDQKYDLCINLCAFIEDKRIALPNQAILNMVSHSPTIVRNENDPQKINHFLYQCYRFIRDSLSQVVEPIRSDQMIGVRTTFSDTAIETATQYASKIGLSEKTPVIMINPDTACELTLLPFHEQSTLLAHLSELDAQILIGAGHTMTGIGKRLVKTLPQPARKRINIIPAAMPLDAYSALIDFADLFITGDTGPMHIAASRRFSRSGHYQFRNRTAVLSIFGATPPRMSGYDSFQPGYLPANQSSPSWSYTAGSPCRNITCLNKMFKTCKTIKCFETVDIDGLADTVRTQLKQLRREPSKSTHTTVWPPEAAL